MEKASSQSREINRKCFVSLVRFQVETSSHSQTRSTFSQRKLCNKYTSSCCPLDSVGYTRRSWIRSYSKNEAVTQFQLKTSATPTNVATTKLNSPHGELDFIKIPSSTKLKMPKCSEHKYSLPKNRVSREARASSAT